MARSKADEAEVEEEPVVCLHYTGGETGDRYIMGVPTTDLHDVPGAEAHRLIDSGLYDLLPDHSHEGSSDTGD